MSDPELSKLPSPERVMMRRRLWQLAWRAVALLAAAVVVDVAVLASAVAVTTPVAVDVVALVMAGAAEDRARAVFHQHEVGDVDG